jgi:hypothetical protein
VSVLDDATAKIDAAQTALTAMFNAATDKNERAAIQDAFDALSVQKQQLDAAVLDGVATSIAATLNGLKPSLQAAQQGVIDHLIAQVTGSATPTTPTAPAQTPPATARPAAAPQASTPPAPPSTAQPRPASAAAGGALRAQIVQIATASPVMGFNWPQRGHAPAGYIKGMALTFARVYCKLLASDAGAKEIAQPIRDDNDDVLVHYAERFAASGMDNTGSASDRLRHLFTLLVGHGMRESSGEYGEGADPNNHDQNADTSEAGLFQTSFNLRRSVGHVAPPLMDELINLYTAHGDSFLDTFKEGCRAPKPDVGVGPGQQFQQLCKTAPAFGAEFTLIGYRHQYEHWGPLANLAADLNTDCDQMLARVQALVDQASKADRDSLLS